MHLFRCARCDGWVKCKDKRCPGGDDVHPFDRLCQACLDAPHIALEKQMKEPT